MKHPGSLRWLTSGLWIAALLLVPLASAQAGHVLTEFARPGAAATALWDVNNLGHMVGYSFPGTAPTDFPVGFVYDGSAFATISGPAGAISSSALGISDGGTVVGSYFSTFTTDIDGNVIAGPSQGYIYSSGSYTIFSVAGAQDTFLRGISPDGRYISGYYTSATRPGTGFVYDTAAGTLAIVSLPASLLTIPQSINAAGILVGSDIISGPPTTRPGFTFDIASGTRTDQFLAGAVRTAFRSIDDAGTLAGWFQDSGFVQHGFVGTPSSYEQMDFPGADATVIEGSNNAGVLVGTFFIGAGTYAFVASPVAAVLEELAADVIGVGSGRSLANKVALIQAYHAAGDVAAACAMLEDFVREVRAQAGKKIAPLVAAQLIADAEAIMDSLGCG
jgi:uncharacterized membrane protein